MAAALVASAVIAGCGGAGGDKQPYKVQASTTVATASPRLTEAQFVSRANRLCREGWKTVVHNFVEYNGWQEGKAGKKATFAESVRLSLLAGIDFHIFDEIQRLGSAPGQEKQLEAIIGALQEAVELGQLKRWQAYSAAEVPPHFRKFNPRAQSYGLGDCLVSQARLRALES